MVLWPCRGNSQIQWQKPSGTRYCVGIVYILLNDFHMKTQVVLDLLWQCWAMGVDSDRVEVVLSLSLRWFWSSGATKNSWKCLTIVSQNC